jgi:Uma2 family endonuclease
MTLFQSARSILLNGHLRGGSPRNQTMGMALPVPQFTIEMLDDFPDDGNRYEVLEGMLLVTPAPSITHQIVATRLVNILMNALAVGPRAHVVAVGALQRGENTQLLPDILVFPAASPPATEWRTVQEWWLAIEVMSPSSRVYDRVVKRDAYLALGVEEYWVVDIRDRSIEVFKRGKAGSERAVNSLTWRPVALGGEVIVHLEEVFRDAGDDVGD